MRTNGSGTRDRLLDSAEELFGTRGIDGSPLRDITGLAGANLSSVSYHFGSKEGLLRAVLGRRMAPLNRERIRLLDLAELAAGAAGPALPAVLHAYLGPPLRLLREHPTFMRFLGRALTDESPEVQGMLSGDLCRDVEDRFRRAIHRTLPDVSPSDLSWCLTFLSGAMAHTWLRWPVLDGALPSEPASNGVDELVRRLVAFGAAGIRAAVGGVK